MSTSSLQMKKRQWLSVKLSRRLDAVSVMHALHIAEKFLDVRSRLRRWGLAEVTTLAQTQVATLAICFCLHRLIHPGVRL